MQGHLQFKAGHQWHDYQQHNLSNFSYKKLISGVVSIFFKSHDGRQITIILVHVNNMAIFGSLDHIQDDFKHLIGSIYKHTDVGEIKQFGLHIIHDCSKQTLSIDQTHYVQHIFKL